MFSPDHPLLFSPILRSYLWGGSRLVQQLGKKGDQNGAWAESWEVVDHREAESVVSEGPFQGKTLRELLESFSEDILGYTAPDERFPLLLKYLDCQRVLSVQVHPDDAYGAKMPVPDRGKTEAWYVIDAEPGAKLYAGLLPGIGFQELSDAVAAGTTEECLHVLYPRPGDCVFIPAGTLHALGAGLLVAEIQQASDCTFRLFDWNRVDQNGKPRELHLQQAMEVIDFSRGPVNFATKKARADGWNELVCCDKFTLLESSTTKPLEIPSGRASLLTLPLGQGELVWKGGDMDLPRASTVLLPARCEKITLRLAPDSTALLSLLPAPT